MSRTLDGLSFDMPPSAEQVIALVLYFAVIRNVIV